MSKASATSPTLPKIGMASPQQEGSRGLSTYRQRAFEFNGSLRRDELTAAIYDLFRSAVKTFGGLDALRAALDERESYTTTISKALNRVDDGNGQRKVPLEWLAALGADEEAAYELVCGLSELFGFDPPSRKVDIDQDDIEKAAWGIIDEIPDPEQREMMIRRLARKLGVRRERLKK